MARIPAPPSFPPKTDEELAIEAKLSANMEDTIRRLRQRNLDAAVLLAQQAARGRGPLVEHFRELGRRYAHTLKAPQKPQLRLVEGDLV